MLVSHPDAATVVWELDLPGLRPALDVRFEAHAEGFLRLVFERRHYEADILAMARALQRRAAEPVPVRELPAELEHVEVLRREQPDLQQLQVETLEPDTRRGLALEELMALDLRAPAGRELLWPPGTVLEFGFFHLGDGHELMRIDGLPVPHLWPGWYFTRWEALSAFNGWLAFTSRAFGLSDELRPAGVGCNEFVLRRESDREPCHAAGRYLAEVMQVCLDEGETAPGVRVRYCEGSLCARLERGA